LFPTKLTEELTKSEGKATVGRGHLGESFGEDAPPTVRLITVELADVQMQEDLHVLNREIPDGALIAAMDPMSGRATHRTGRALSHAFTGEDQAPGLSAEGKKTEAAKMRKEGF
jgi:hypothetical protein